MNCRTQRLKNERYANTFTQSNGNSMVIFLSFFYIYRFMDFNVLLELFYSKFLRNLFPFFPKRKKKKFFRRKIFSFRILSMRNVFAEFFRTFSFLDSNFILRNHFTKMISKAFSIDNSTIMKIKISLCTIQMNLLSPGKKIVHLLYMMNIYRIGYHSV